MKFESVFEDPTCYLFREISSDDLYFVGIFGHLGVVTRVLKLLPAERTDFEKNRKTFPLRLRADIESNTERFKARFVDGVDDNQEIVETIKKVSFGKKEATFLQKLTQIFK